LEEHFALSLFTYLERVAEIIFL